MAAHQPDPERSLLPSQSIPSTHRDHTDLEKTQRSATTSRLAAQSFAVSRGGVVSSSWRVCCVVSQRAYLFSFCCTFDRGCHRCFHPQQRGVWMCQVIVGLIKGKFKDQWKDVTGLTRPDDKQSAVNFDPWRTLRQSLHTLHTVLLYLCHSDLKHHW